ncbi:sulfurtransferase [Flavobacteriales bacterium]|nr:sulfurtransferase [Flavobacteriales bacterium]
MNWIIKALSFGFLFFMYSCGSEQQSQGSVQQIQTAGYASTKYLIEAEELREKLLLGSNLKLIDFRRVADFNAGHIQGAVNLWRSQIEDSTYSYRGMMPNRVQLEKLLGHLGISPSDTIIIYDNKAEVDAARLWWILRFYGHRNMKLLNGGLKGWELIDSAITTDTVNFTSTTYTFETPVDSSIYASYRMVSSAIEEEHARLLDTRGLDEFTGTKLKKGAARPGHISSAINLDWAEAIDYNGNHKFLAAKELRFKYEPIGIEQNNSIICYCHSGVRSAHTFFVLTELLGYQDVRNYDGSWVEWSHLTPEEDQKLP